MTKPRTNPNTELANRRIKQYKNRRFLVEMYLDSGLTAQEIADKCGVSQNTILNWLHRWDLPVRPQGWEGHVG